MKTTNKVLKKPTIDMPKGHGNCEIILSLNNGQCLPSSIVVSLYPKNMKLLECYNKKRAWIDTQ